MPCCGISLTCFPGCSGLACVWRQTFRVVAPLCWSIPLSQAVWEAPCRILASIKGCHAASVPIMHCQGGSASSPATRCLVQSLAVQPSIRQALCCDLLIEYAPCCTCSATQCHRPCCLLPGLESGLWPCDCSSPTSWRHRATSCSFIRLHPASHVLQPAQRAVLLAPRLAARLLEELLRGCLRPAALLALTT